MKHLLHCLLALAMHVTLAITPRPRASPGVLLDSRPDARRAPLRLSANLNIGAEPPGEFRIWAYGPVETVKGVFSFTARSAELVMQFARDYGNDLFFDYDHAFWTDGGEPDKGKAAGWFNLEVRADGLWAVNIRWTPAADAAIRAGEWRYFSPALDTDDITGEITRLWNIALTNLPATRNMQPLTSFNVRDLRTPDVQASVSLDSLYRLLADALWLRFRDAWIVEVFNDQVVFDQSGTLFQLPYSVNGTSVVLGDTATEVVRTYSPVPGGHTMKHLLTLLGLKPDATEAEAVTALNARLAASDTFRTTVLSVAGTQDEAAAVGILQANAQAAAQLPTVRAELDAVRAEQARVKLSGLIEQGKRDGKLTPALLPWAEAQSFETLSAFLQHAPTVVAPATDVPRQPTGDATPTDLGAQYAGKKWEDLKPMQKAELHNVRPDLYRALKADYESRTGTRVGSAARDTDE